MKIGFYGAAKEVTGSKHLITLNSGTKFLLDCGLFQGSGQDVDEWNKHFGFNPAELDFMILSHAHIDHSGLIPKLVKEGFRGKIYCTPGTNDLCKLMLVDSAHIQETDVMYINKRRAKQNKPPIPPLYTIEDAQAALSHFRNVRYNEAFKINDEVELTFTDAGHILGSASVHLKIKEGYQTKRLTFSGDIGRYGNTILRDPAPIPQADYIITESTYGNRLHEPVENLEEELLKIVHQTIIEDRGKIIIPAFSVGRTQQLVYALNRLEFYGKLPKIPVFVDSPLAVDATEVVIDHEECYNDKMLQFMKEDEDPFGFKGLRYITEVSDSKMLNFLEEPCIIISASGMAEAGRIKHHIKNNISNPKNTILFVGYCSPHSLGGRLIQGQEEVKIYGEFYKVKAQVKKINGFSAHGDYHEMLSYLDGQDRQVVKKVFLVHGEENVMDDYKLKLQDKGFNNIYIPSYKEEIEI